MRIRILIKPSPESNSPEIRMQKRKKRVQNVSRISHADERKITFVITVVLFYPALFLISEIETGLRSSSPRMRL